MKAGVKVSEGAGNFEVKEIDVFYGELQALFKVSLEVKRGRIISVLGANGAGKSTLLKAMSKLLK